MTNNKWYFTTSAIVFTVVAIAHLGRIVYMLEANIGGVDIPLWVSGVAVMIAGYLALRGFMAARSL